MLVQQSRRRARAPQTSLKFPTLTRPSGSAACETQHASGPKGAGRSPTRKFAKLTAIGEGDERRRHLHGPSSGGE